MSEDTAAVFAVMVASKWAFIKVGYLDLSQTSRPRDTRPDSWSMNNRSITDQGVPRQSLLEQLAISNASAMRIFFKISAPKGDARLLEGATGSELGGDGVENDSHTTSSCPSP